MHVAANIATTLNAVMDERQLSLRGVETETGVDHDTVRRIVAGQVWADTWTVARLEDGLHVQLWPSRPQ